MAIDHSLTYRNRSFKNLPHKVRLGLIIKIASRIDFEEPYCDVGCSNGYITNILSDKLGIKSAVGMDHNAENIEIARRSYKNIKFNHIDLNNRLSGNHEKFSFVTCFETLEHVGNFENAMANIFSLLDEKGKLFISVPIETGFIGLIKFLIKTLLFRYSLSEINIQNRKYFYFEYLGSLITGKSVSRYRKDCAGFCTHFGFDYRLVDKWIKNKGISYTRLIRGSTAFFLVCK